jgi:predicted nuclease of predicted toxin-antitoxin system
LKLLFDENLSPRLVELLAADFPDCTHLEHLGMRGAADAAVWDFARENGYSIVSKDNDFRQRAFLHGPPPKVVWLAVGNAGTNLIATLIRAGSERLRAFDLDLEESLLILEAPATDSLPLTGEQN